MPRRNRHKVFTTGKAPVFSSDAPARAECAGCAFAGYGGGCATSDGVCLITRPERREGGDADHQQRTDTAGEKR
jgi:hypothetical protein